MGRGTYRLFDHTADIGVEISAPTLQSLFETAAESLFDLLADTSSVSAREERSVVVAGADLDDLLVRWLAELLYMHDAEGWLFSRFAVPSVAGERLEGVAAGELYDPGRHRIKTEIKAVTYHQAAVTRTENGWKARIVFDV